MAKGTKIATCCYCGTRAALVLSGKGRHELACSACGAPLHDLKMLPKSAKGERDLVRHSKAPSAASISLPREDIHDRYKKRRKKKRKSFAKKFFEEAFDVLEDIFD